MLKTNSTNHKEIFIKNLGHVSGFVTLTPFAEHQERVAVPYVGIERVRPGF